MNDFSNLNSARIVMEAAARDKHSPEKIQAKMLSEIEKCPHFGPDSWLSSMGTQYTELATRADIAIVINLSSARL